MITIAVKKIYRDALDIYKKHPQDSGFDVHAHNFVKVWRRPDRSSQDPETVLEEGIDPVNMVRLRGDSVSDIYQLPVTLYPLERVLVGTGLIVEASDNMSNPTFMFDFEARPRSGKAIKEGLTVINTPGTIDYGYTGELGICIVNLDTVPHTIKVGDGVAQIVPKLIFPVTEVVYKEGSSTRVGFTWDGCGYSSRADGAYGSTGR